ncbi:MAG: hypothetical protein N3F64_07510 [Nitrososphaeria archaeon]|nr:hypothetical protein [Nitrososphaeria archaeon]
MNLDKEDLARKIINEIKVLKELKVGQMPMILGPIHFHDKTGYLKDLEKTVDIGIDPIGITISVGDDSIKIYSDGVFLLDDDIEKMYNIKLTEEEIEVLNNFENPFARAKIRKRYPKIVRLYKYSKYSIGRLNKYYRTNLKLAHKGRFYYVETILDVKNGDGTVENVVVHVKALAIFLKNFNEVLRTLAGYTRFKM